MDTAYDLKINEMKKKFLKIGFLSLAGAITLVVGLSSFTYHKMKHAKSEIYYEMKNFVNDSVLPIMRPMRNELDKSLSVLEQQKIKEMRATALELANFHLNLHDKFREGNKQTTASLSTTEKAKMKDAQKQMRKIIAECWTILDNHEVEFETINAQLTPNISSWKNSIHEKFMKHAPFHKGKCEEHCGTDHPAHHEIGDGFIAPVLFILWDTETNFPVNMFENAMEKHLKE